MKKSTIFYLFVLGSLFLFSGCNSTPRGSQDTVKPVIILNGDPTVEITVGDKYTDAGASARDDRDGDITVKIIVSNPVDTTKPGTYTVTYNVSDAAGNKADEVSRTVVVQKAIIQPTINTQKEAYSPNEIVTITVAGDLSGDKDWAGIYPVDANNSWDNVIAWNWVNDAGKVVLDNIKLPMAQGKYEARLFFHNSIVKPEARSSFGVTYHYGAMGRHDVNVSVYSKNNKVVVYHPSNWDDKSTPVIFFSPGWHSTDHMKYDTLLRFIASHGYSVVYEPDDKDTSRQDQLDEFDDTVNEFADKLNTDKIGVLGHSSGGGFVYKILEHMITKGYGSRKDGINQRFLFTMDGYFAEYMDKENMQGLKNSNIGFIQFGNTGNGTDPRIVLVNYGLFTGENIDKNYIVIKGEGDADHLYPERKKIEDMQGLLKPLDAMIEYTFTIQSDQNHKLALEGSGKANPYKDGYQKVFEKSKYTYSCDYANEYHKGADWHTQSTIDNCGTPEIEPN